MKCCTKCGKLKPLENFYRSGKNKRKSICIDCYKEYRKISDYKPESRYKKYIRDAKRRKLVFKLTREEFFSFEDKPCRYCGEKVHPISLDRIDNLKGYILSNVDACCSDCNFLKHEFDESNFLSQVHKIFEYQTGKCKNDKQESLGKKDIKKDIIDSKRV